MAKENIKSIVVDVRNTSEGMMEYAAKVIDLFVPLATEGNKAIALAVNKRATQWRPLPPMQGLCRADLRAGQSEHQGPAELLPAIEGF